MLGGLRRAWHTWRGKARLLAPLWYPPPGSFVAPELAFPELRAVLDAGGPELPIYHGLVAVWNEYAATHLADYPAFLAALARGHRFPIGSVLDLACGTGVLADRLAGGVAEVVGLDESEPMLAAARGRVSRPGVSFVRGDMRGFDLGRWFDAAVCASNSLNYVADRAELGRVLAAVARHLRPGGLFVFDATTAHGMRLMAGHWFHSTPGGRPVAMRSEYDPVARRQTVRVLTAAGAETHRRIALDKADVRAAAAASGLTVLDQFSTAELFGDWEAGGTGYHLLRRPG
jgi:SAM-dependent methyltransferase